MKDAYELNQFRTGDYPEFTLNGKKKKKSTLKVIPKTIRTTRWWVEPAKVLRFVCSKMHQNIPIDYIGQAPMHY